MSNHQVLWEKPVCQLDENGLFLGMAVAELDVYARDGSYIMPAYCVDTTPPESRPNHIAQWQNGAWHYLPDYRNVTAFDKTTGEAVTITEIGELPDHLTLELRPSPYHVWQETKQTWKLDAALEKQGKAAELAHAKLAKLTELNESAQQYINKKAGLDLIPAFELQTWTIQAQEAHAWHKDPQAVTPTLDTIAVARGVPPEMLKQRAYEKAVAFETLTANVVGIRQAIETRIKATQDMDELNAIEFAFELPESE